MDIFGGVNQFGVGDIGDVDQADVIVFTIHGVVGGVEMEFAEDDWLVEVTVAVVGNLAAVHVVTDHIHYFHASTEHRLRTIGWREPASKIQVVVVLFPTRFSVQDHDESCPTNFRGCIVHRRQ